MTEKLEKGVLDFAVVVEEPDRKKYHALRFPDSDLWGLVMPASCDHMYLIWGKNQVFTPIAEQFIRELKHFMP